VCRSLQNAIFNFPFVLSKGNYEFGEKRKENRVFTKFRQLFLFFLFLKSETCKYMESRPDPDRHRTIVVKLGTSIVFDEKKDFGGEYLAQILSEIGSLWSEKNKFVLVCSGAVTLGKYILDNYDGLSSQLYASVGQLSISHFCYNECGMIPAQFLVSNTDLSSNQAKNELAKNLRRAMASDILPIVNENDALSTKIEWDNDKLSAEIAELISADLLLILSDIDGIYRKSSTEHRRSVGPIRTFDSIIGIEMDTLASSGRGGVESKIRACRSAVESGVSAAIVCNGTESNIVGRVLKGEPLGTLFRKRSIGEIRPENSDDPQSTIAKLRSASRVLASSNYDRRREILRKVVDAIGSNARRIVAANKRDVSIARARKIPKHLVDRLRLSFDHLARWIDGMYDIVSIRTVFPTDPIGRIVWEEHIKNGNFVLRKCTVPIGVLLSIFESRPDVLLQTFSLTLLTGNGLLFKSGKEAKHTIGAIYDTIKCCLREYGDRSIENCLIKLDTRGEVDRFLRMHDGPDLVVPRGGADLIRYVCESSKAPVLSHADGVCHIFLDEACKSEDALSIVVDAKMQYPAACNALETLLVHEGFGNLEDLLDRLKGAGIELRAGPRLHNLQPEIPLIDSFHIEYGDHRMTVEIVANVKEAIDHINQYGSNHTDCIVTENNRTAEEFLSGVDSASVFRNVSTRFADGKRFGLGAEVGISTSRVHARGPVSVEGLLTTKYIATSDRICLVSLPNGSNKNTLAQ
jgi:delta-1-pyrroline-5-carboxylate synthetase